MTDPFALKLYSRIQNNIGPNISDGLNFITREQSMFYWLTISIECKYIITARNEVGAR